MKSMPAGRVGRASLGAGRAALDPQVLDVGSKDGNKPGSLVGSKDGSRPGGVRLDKAAALRSGSHPRRQQQEPKSP